MGSLRQLTGRSGGLPLYLFQKLLILQRMYVVPDIYKPPFCFTHKAPCENFSHTAALFFRLQFQTAQRRRLCLLQQHSQRKADGDTGDPLNDIAGNTGGCRQTLAQDHGA